jgi:hypothetical protein
VLPSVPMAGWLQLDLWTGLYGCGMLKLDIFWSGIAIIILLGEFKVALAYHEISETHKPKTSHKS